MAFKDGDRGKKRHPILGGLLPATSIIAVLDLACTLGTDPFREGHHSKCNSGLMPCRLPAQFAAESSVFAVDSESFAVARETPD